MSFEELIFALWTKKKKNIEFAPSTFKYTIDGHIPRYRGTDQHDSFEFLINMIDGLHEDVNLVTHKPYGNTPDSDGRPDEVVAKEQWDYFKSRNTSLIIDLFYGQIKTYFKWIGWNFENMKFDSYSSLNLPIPSEKGQILNLDIMYHPYNNVDEGGVTRYKVENWSTNTTFRLLSEKMGLILGNSINFQFYVQNDEEYSLLSKQFS